jgi:hypothetical protein
MSTHACRSTCMPSRMIVMQEGRRREQTRKVIHCLVTGRLDACACKAWQAVLSAAQAQAPMHPCACTTPALHASVQARNEAFKGSCSLLCDCTFAVGHNTEVCSTSPSVVAVLLVVGPQPDTCGCRRRPMTCD